MAATTITAFESPRNGVVNTVLNYYLDPEKGGFTSYQVGVSDYYRRKFKPHPAQIHNIRGREDQYKLNTHGFQRFQHVSTEKDFDDTERIKQVVYPEIEQLIIDVTSATRVHVFSHITRKDSLEKVEKKINSDPELKDGSAPVSTVTPAHFIHVDFSEKGAVQILQDNFDRELGERLRKTRWAIINVWRPIKPISKDPLAVCDAQSVRDEDLVPITGRLPPKGSGQYADVSGGSEFELFYKRYHQDEEWYYADAMKPNEVLMIKIFDSLRDGKTARRCPHTAFTNPDTKDDPTRESIEVRSLVFSRISTFEAL